MDELQAGMALDGTIFSLELTTLDLSVKIVSEDERATGVSFTSRPASKQVRGRTIVMGFTSRPASKQVRG